MKPVVPRRVDVKKMLKSLQSNQQGANVKNKKDLKENSQLKKEKHNDASGILDSMVFYLFL